MAALRYTKPEPIELKNHGEFTERWLQDRIYEDPTILGLGDVEVIDQERKQDKAGRLDLLLFSREENCRYEVELMLGQTDESHIIRCIEYWDIERRRYPGYDHCAVLVAEDITTRFLNILALFSGTIPFIAIQLNALKVGDQIVLDFVRVLDRVALRQDDEGEGNKPVGRDYWNTRATPETVKLADTFLDLINQTADPKLQLKFNRYYIGLHDGLRARNFIDFKPKKKWLELRVDISDGAKWVGRFEEAGIEAGIYDERLWVAVEQKHCNPCHKLLAELVEKAVEEYKAS